MFHYPNVTISLFTIKLKRLNVSISSLHIHNQIEKAECTITVYSHHKARKYTAVCRTNPKKKTQRCLESSILQYQISVYLEVSTTTSQA